MIALDDHAELRIEHFCKKSDSMLEIIEGWSISSRSTIWDGISLSKGRRTRSCGLTLKHNPLDYFILVGNFWAGRRTHSGFTDITRGILFSVERVSAPAC